MDHLHPIRRWRHFRDLSNCFVSSLYAAKYPSAAHHMGTSEQTGRKTLSTVDIFTVIRSR